MEDHIEQRLMNPDAPVVFNKAVLTKAVHKETDAGAGGPNHFRQGFLSDVGNQRLRFTGLAELRHEQHGFSDLFLKFLLARAMRTQADLVDQLFNSSEKRLARILLLMAEFGQPGEPESLIPKITQETLAEMIGTTRSRVSYFMNRFRQHGFIEYNGRIRVHKSLLNVILHDQSLGQNSISAPLVETGSGQSEAALRRAAAVGVKVRHHDGLKD